MFLKKLASLCLALISFALTSINAICDPTHNKEFLNLANSINENDDVSSASNAKVNSKIYNEWDSDETTESDSLTECLSPSSLYSRESDLSSIGSESINEARRIKVRRIAMIGGGGAGSTTAILLSNLSKLARHYGLRFEITIFERGKDIITGSTFEIAAVNHAGGCEYPEDVDTITDCQVFGSLGEKMLPGLYENSLPIMYFTRTGSSLTSEMQQKAFTQAKENIGRPMTPVRELSLEEVQYAFGDPVSGGVISKKDKPTNIFERNARIRKCIERDHEITVKTNTRVSGVVKNTAGTFSIMVDDKPTDQSFDHVIMTAWDSNQNILDASENSSDLGLTAEDRVIALCNISGVPHLQNTPFFTLQGGLMFMPISNELGLVYRCTEGGSYPEAGTTEIPLGHTIKHGEKILEELKTAGFSHNGRNPFEEVKLLGAKVLKIMKESGKPSHQRPHVPPVVTSENIIVGTPTKATYIPWLALQMIEKFLEQLSDASEFSNIWLKAMHQLFLDNRGVCTEEKLPEVFTIQTAIEKDDIQSENFKLFESFQLTKEGTTYQSKLHGLSPLRRARTIHSSLSDTTVAAPSCVLNEPGINTHHVLSPVSVASSSLFSSNSSASDDSLLSAPAPINRSRSGSRFVNRTLDFPQFSHFDLVISYSNLKSTTYFKTNTKGNKSFRVIVDNMRNPLVSKKF